MTPEEKAKELKIKFFILPEENIGVAKMTGEEMSRLARQCAIIAANEIKKELIPVGALEGKTWHITSYWNKVIKELETH